MEYYFPRLAQAHRVVAVVHQNGDSPAYASAELNRWENALLTAMRSNGVVIDLPILNSLLQHRTTRGLIVDQLMALANRQGLSSDVMS